jgi:hypothetical protein
MFEGFQFPKTILMWIENHPGTASWVQAVGAISIIATTLYIARSDRRDRLLVERRRAEALAVLLHTELVGFRGQIDLAIDHAGTERSRLMLPQSLVTYGDQLFLLGSAGALLMQMMSAVNANNATLNEIVRLQATNIRELVERARSTLRTTRDKCSEAIAGIDEIIKRI